MGKHWNVYVYVYTHVKTANKMDQIGFEQNQHIFEAYHSRVHKRKTHKKWILSICVKPINLFALFMRYFFLYWIYKKDTYFITAENT